MKVGQHRRCGLKEWTSKIFVNLSPCFFPQLYPGHFGFWPMRKNITLLCLENIQSIFLSIALKHTKAGPRSSGTLFLVILI